MKIRFARGSGVAAAAVVLIGLAGPNQARGQSDERQPGLALDEVTGGTLLFRLDEAGALTAAPTVETDVYMRATGPILRAQVAQTFHNPSSDWVEGIYVFPLPEDAAVDSLHMVVGGRIIDGRIQETAAARRTYDDARRTGRKAALLESRRPNLFTAKVANIGPGERVQTVIEYQQLLGYDGGEFRLRFPMFVQPRHFESPERPPADTEESVDRALLTCGLPAAPSGSFPITLAVELEPGFALSALYSASHAIETEEAPDGTYVVTLAGDEPPAARDFELAWAPALNQTPQAALLAEHYGDATYVMLMVVPPAPQAPVHSLSRDVIFVIDTSGSMHGASLEQAKLALLMALDRLKPYDRFNVVEFNTYVRRIWSGSVPADAQSLGIARNMVESLGANGGTEMYPALVEALENDGGHGDVRQVVFITDGAVGNERGLFEYIKAHLDRTRLFTVGIGPAPNAYFMRKAAHFGRGTFTYIGDAAQVSSRMEELFEKLETPVLTDVEVDWSDPNADAMPDQVPDLYSREPLVLTARLFADDAVVRVRGRRGGDLWDNELPVGDYALEAAAWDPDTVEPEPRTMRGISKLWARRQIEGLMDSVVEGADAVSVRDAVVNLALTHHLVTKYTSLVAVDTTPSAPRTADPTTRGVVQSPTTAVGRLPQTATIAPLYFALAIAALLVALGMMLVPALGGIDLGGRLGRFRLVGLVRRVGLVR